MSLNETNKILFHAAHETSESNVMFCEKMLWRPHHLPSSWGSKAVAPAQNRSPTGTARRFHTARGSRGVLKGAGTGGTLLFRSCQVPTSSLWAFLTCGWCLCISKCPVSTAPALQTNRHYYNSIYNMPAKIATV